MPKRKPLPLFPEPEYQVSEVELHYIFKGRAAERPKITRSDDAYKIFRDSWDENKIDLCEEFKVIYVNRANRVLSLFRASVGGIAGTCVEPRHIIALAILQNASGFILGHNHPSGNLEPSAADIEITRKTTYGAKPLDLQVLDHIIVGRHGYTSLADGDRMPV